MVGQIAPSYTAQVASMVEGDIVCDPKPFWFGVVSFRLTSTLSALLCLGELGGVIRHSSPNCLGAHAAHRSSVLYVILAFLTQITHPVNDMASFSQESDTTSNCHRSQSRLLRRVGPVGYTARCTMGLSF